MAVIGFVVRGSGGWRLHTPCRMAGLRSLADCRQHLLKFYSAYPVIWQSPFLAMRQEPPAPVAQIRSRVIAYQSPGRPWQYAGSVPPRRCPCPDVASRTTCCGAPLQGTDHSIWLCKNRPRSRHPWRANRIHSGWPQPWGILFIKYGTYVRTGRELLLGQYSRVG